MPYPKLKQELITSWSGVREGVIAEVEQLSDAQLGTPLAEGGRSPLEIARHIAESGLRMVDYTREPDAPLKRREHYRDKVAGAHDRQSMVELLRETWAETEAVLREIPADALDASIRGITGDESSRLSFLNFAMAHEMYHRGQLALCARAQGLTPALTQRMAAARASAPARG